jgi:glycosyltransferase involved in cell wall biosynthesis
MGAGMGVVAFDCPTGPADIIRDRANGILVPPTDVEGLAAGIRAMFEDPDLRRRCAAAVATAGEYSIASVGPHWEALFERLWRERQGRPIVIGDATAPAQAAASERGG